MSRVLRSARWSKPLQIFDQFTYSTTNLLFTLTVASTSSSRTFGAFSLAYLGTTLAQNAARVSYFSRFFDDVARGALSSRSQRDAATIVGSGIASGVVAALVLVVVGTIAPGELGYWYLVLAPVVPLVLAQDALRHVFLARGDALDLVVLDVAWLVAQVAAIFALRLIFGGLTPLGGMTAWTIGCGVSLVGGLAATRTVPAPRRGGLYARSLLSDDRVYLLDALGESMQRQVLLGAAGGGLGLSAAGVFRGAQTLFTPSGNALVGLRPAAVRSMMNARERGANLWLIALEFALVGVTLSLATGALIAFTPVRFGTKILGESWLPATQLILPLATLRSVMSCVTAMQSYLLARRLPRAIVSARIITMALLVLGAFVGAATGNLNSFSWSLALAASIALIVWVAVAFVSTSQSVAAEGAT